MAPLWFFVDVVIRPGAQAANQLSVRHDHRARRLGAGWLIHEWHELIREARHGATDADSAYVWAAADTGHPAALGDVAIHHGAPAADFHQTFRRAIFAREIALLVIAG